jgi:hypothetical protein
LRGEAKLRGQRLATFFTCSQRGKEQLKTNSVVKFFAAESPFAFFIVQMQVFIDILRPT